MSWSICSYNQQVIANKILKELKKRAIEKAEKRKASILARVEHAFRVVKRQFGYVKVGFRRLTKNTAQILTLFALSNPWMVRKQLLAMAGKPRPPVAW